MQGIVENPEFTWENTPNYWRYGGEQRDAENGLHYLRARYYDAATGRFLSKDPLSGGADQPQTQNPYPYVMNNPMTLSDPSGMSADFGWDFLGIPEPECGVGDAGCWFDYMKNVLSPAIDAFLDAYDLASRFLTPECGIAFFGALGFLLGGPAGFAVSALGAFAIGGLSSGPRGAASSSSDSGNDVLFAWLRKYMQANRAWGSVTLKGKGWSS
jgi:RHS repeat-associated protein